MKDAKCDWDWIILVLGFAVCIAGVLAAAVL